MARFKKNYRRELLNLVSDVQPSIHLTVIHNVFIVIYLMHDDAENKTKTCV